VNITNDRKYIYAVGDGGATGFEGNVGLITAYGEDLSITTQQRLAYQGHGNIVLNSSFLDWENYDLYVAGYTTEEGRGGKEALVAKLHGYDHGFTLTNARIYGGPGDDIYNGITVYNGEVYLSGQTNNETNGGFDSFIVRYDKDLKNPQKYIYGSSGADLFKNLQVTSGGIYTVGSTPISGKGDLEVLATKIKTLKTGSFGSVAAGLDYKISNLVEDKSNVTIGDNNMKAGDGKEKELLLDKFTSGTIGSKYYRYLTY
jgi:hypothetical protein